MANSDAASDAPAVTPVQVDLAVRVGPLALANPVLTASGCFGHGEALTDLVDYDGLGGLVSKSVSRAPMPGNPPPRVCEVAQGLLNSIGLANDGVERFITHELGDLTRHRGAAIVSIFGESIADYAACARALETAPGIDALELNLGCPNTAAGGVAFGSSPEATAAVVRAVRAATTRPLIVKLTPNVTDIAAIGRSAVEAGADILAAINTVFGMAVDWRRRVPRLHGAWRAAAGADAGPACERASGIGGHSGPAIKPQALYAIHRLHQALPDTPLIGIGGIATADDVLEFVVAGASAVQIGTSAMVDPTLLNRLPGKLRSALASAGERRLAGLIGTLRLPERPASSR